MKKTHTGWKKILSLFAAVLMAVTLLPATVFAYYGTDWQGGTPVDFSKVYLTDQEIPEDAVVYISVSQDDVYVISDGMTSGVPMAYVPVRICDIAQIDLDDYDLGAYKYPCIDESTGLPMGYYVTLVQLLIYAAENYYSEGWNCTIDGDFGSFHFAKEVEGFFGGDDNLTYYVNGEFPLQYQGWGATCDHIILEAGDFCDVALYSDRDFYSDPGAGYQYFADENGLITHEYTAAPGEALNVNLIRAVCDSDGPEVDYSNPEQNGEHGTYETTFVTADNVIYCSTELYGDIIDTRATENGTASITFANPGTYYLWVNGLEGETEGMIVSTPAFAKVTVEEQTGPVVPVVTADVSVRAQAEGNYLAGVVNEMTVSSDLAENYGFTDEVPGSVSALDALVAEHQVIFGDDFTPETASEYLAASGGMISKVFGIETYAFGFLLNEGYPNDGTPGSSGGYNGTTVFNQAVTDGGLLDFFTYSDASTYGDYFTFLTADTAEVEAGGVLDVTVEGIMPLAGYLYATPEEFRDAAEPLEDAGFVWISKETGEIVETDDISGEDGRAAVTAPSTPGIWYLAGGSTEYTDVIKNPIEITVTEPAAPVSALTVRVVPSTADVTFYYGADVIPGSQLPDDCVEDLGVNGNYHLYSLSVPDGTYCYRAVDGETDLGGMAFDVPAVAEASSDGTGADITLVRVNYYTNNTAVTQAGDYTLNITAGAAGAVTTGAQYTAVASGKTYVYTPVMLQAGGNAVLYNITGTMQSSLAADWCIEPSGNQTFAVTLTAAQTKQLTVRAPKIFSLTAPSDAETKFYYQLNNFNDIELVPESVTDNGDGTTTYGLTYSAFSKVSYRVSKEGEVTQAGFAKDNTSYTVEFPADRGIADTETTAIAYDDNSVLLNIDDSKKTNELALAVGETYRVRAFRAPWEIVNSQTANIMIEPDFHYEVLFGGENISISTVTDACAGNASGNWLDVTALSEGTSIVDVWYDAIDIGGNTSLAGRYGAAAADRHGVFVVNIGPDTNITWNPVSYDGDWDAEFDTVYFTGDHGEFSFAPLEPVNSVHVQSGTAGADVLPENGVFTVPVYDGANIITANTDAGMDFMVVRARQISWTVTNNTTGVSAVNGAPEISRGDSVTISFDTLNMPVPKMSGIYNSGYMSTMKTAYRLNDTYDLTSAGTQYDYITEAKSSITFNAYVTGENTLSAGHIAGTEMGDPPGGHRLLTDQGRSANFNAIAYAGNYSILPDISFNVQDAAAEISYDELVSIKSVSLYAGTNSYTNGFNLTSKNDNNAANWTKTTAAMAGYQLHATVTANSYYNTIELVYWYEGEEAVHVPLTSGIESVISGFTADASKLLNMEIVITPADTSLGDPKVFSYVVYPGSSSLQYVHPVLSSLSATGEGADAGGSAEALELTPAISYTKTDGYTLDLNGSDIITLTGKQLQKYTNASNMSQDNSDAVTVYGVLDDDTTSDGILVQAGGSYPVGTWTLENFDISNFKQLKIEVISYVDSSYSRVYAIDFANRGAGLRITEQPKDLEAQVGDSVSYSVKAVRADSYQWYYSKDNGAKWYKSTASGANTDTITLTVKSSGLATIYRCVVTGAGETLTSEAAGLAHCEITQQPVSAAGSIGQTITFSLEAKYADSYQWYYSKNGGEKWFKSTASGAGTNTLTTYVKKDSLDTVYKCVVTGKDGVKLTSDIVGLANRLKITKQTKAVTAVIGAQVTYAVTTENAASYQWYYSKNGGEKWYKSTAAGAATEAMNLTIKSSNVNTVYKCVITGTDGSTIETEPAGTTDELLITEQPKSVAAKAGDTVTFTTEAVNAESFQWYYSKDGGAKWYKSTAAVLENNISSAMTLTAKSTNLGNVYRCKITGIGGSVIYTDLVSLNGE